VPTVEKAKGRKQKAKEGEGERERGREGERERGREGEREIETSIFCSGGAAYL
jgi:hypothetical protein